MGPEVLHAIGLNMQSIMGVAYFACLLSPAGSVAPPRDEMNTDRWVCYRISQSVVPGQGFTLVPRDECYPL
jgi:hypothetical protein